MKGDRKHYLWGPAFLREGQTRGLMEQRERYTLHNKSEAMADGRIGSLQCLVQNNSRNSNILQFVPGKHGDCAGMRRLVSL